MSVATCVDHKKSVCRRHGVCATLGQLWPVFESLQCHYNDEVIFYGGMTEVYVYNNFYLDVISHPHPLLFVYEGPCSCVCV